jgi:hypothetical protein
VSAGEAAPVDCPPPPLEVPAVPNLVGLALSGGGIRSASFNLGFLQGLAAKNVLGEFDYLSTVSGGGFIGAWWSAWLSRRQRAVGEIFPQAEELEPQRRARSAQLIAAGAETPPAGPPDGSLSAQRDDPIHFVRLFSNYLTPKTGIMSPDTWRLIAYFVRSLSFTWLALVPLLVAAILLAQCIYLFREDTADAFLFGWKTMAAGDARLSLLAVPTAIVGTVYITLVVIWLIETAASRVLATFAIVVLVGVVIVMVGIHTAAASATASLWCAIAAAVGTVLVFAARSFIEGISNPKSLFGRLGSVGQAPPIYATAADRRTWLTQQQERILKFGVFAGVLLLSAAFAHDILNAVFVGIDQNFASQVKKAGGWGALSLTIVSGVYALIKQSPSTTGQTASKPSIVGRILLLVAPPLVVVALLFGLAFGSHSLLVAIAPVSAAYLRALSWAAICLAVVEVFLAVYESFEDPDGLETMEKFSWRRFVPHFLLKWLGQSPAEAGQRPWYQFFSPRGWARIAALAGLAAVFGARPESSPASLWKAMVGIPVNAVALAILGVVVVLSFSRLRWRISLRSARPVVLLTAASVTATLCLLANGGLVPALGLAALLWVVILVGGVIAFGWLADPNLISLHGFYKARLSRAYLGASNTGRDSEEISEAAPGDDIALKEIWNHDIGGPYHLVNTALNLVGGSDLATSQRLAENFVMSRYHCGSARAGYRCTAQYMSGELSLATAVAISGAAVSPTMGSKTPSAAMTLLMSLFNIRLGFWAPTPSGKRWYEGHARLWPFYLLRETLANMGTLGTYCYLTDGGHFDNTGVYALVERGCRHIVVCDCGADPTPTFEDIGNAVRRCRIDFGAEVDLDIDDFVIAPIPGGIGLVHVGYGSITYQLEHLRELGLDEFTEKVGEIVWVKPMVTALSAADVRQYRRAHNDFPQQPTTEQWYDESQFESYRRLGYESALQAFAGPFGPHGPFGP